ncbi:MAG: Rieske 2Fe-2S domain-containing protein [Burkholderiales bacterium]|nr:Rieske 2Fe-2S domain-containing protein [Burkholderiales bacterium]
MNPQDLDPIGWAVVDDKARGVFRVHRRAFVDAQILELERARIFSRCWIYAAHASEVAEPGQYVARKVAGRELIVNRDRDGRLHVFFNTCTHRGALVCREAKGRARNFSCPYHGWTFADDGRLVHQPIPESYAPDCNSDGALNLREVPRFDEFCGFIFVNYDAQAIPLADYLADAGDYLRMASQHGAAGAGMEIVSGTQTYCAKANWKLLQENSADGYHADTTHASYMDYIKAREGSVLNLYSEKGFGRVRNLGRGHSVSESIWGTPWGRPCARAMPSFGAEIKAEMDAVFETMAARVGRERADFICHGDRNLLIFPNLVVNDVCALTIRTFYPSAPDYFEVNAWALAPRGESQTLRDLRLRNYLEFLGPGGFATPDDQEMLELCQRGYQAHAGVEWNDLSRGMATEDGPSPAKQDELQMRTFWRRWRDLLAGAAV